MWGQKSFASVTEAELGDLEEAAEKLHEKAGKKVSLKSIDKEEEEEVKESSASSLLSLGLSVGQEEGTAAAAAEPTEGKEGKGPAESGDKEVSKPDANKEDLHPEAQKKISRARVLANVPIGSSDWLSMTPTERRFAHAWNREQIKMVMGATAGAPGNYLTTTTYLPARSKQPMDFAFTNNKTKATGSKLPSISFAAREWLKSVLIKDNVLRPTAHQAMFHPWIRAKTESKLKAMFGPDCYKEFLERVQECINRENEVLFHIKPDGIEAANVGGSKGKTVSSKSKIRPEKHPARVSKYFWLTWFKADSSAEAFD